MKKTVLAVLLGICMLFSLVPTFAFTASGEGAAPDEAPAVPENGAVICPVCQAENCTKSHVLCDTCKVYDCGVDHTAVPAGEIVKCETCGLENCESKHENWCEECKKDDCGIDHSTPKTCETCGETLTEGHTCPTDPVCSCSVLCKADAPKSDCTVCSAEGGVCTGSNKYMKVQAMIDALRTEFKESEREAALAEYEAVTKAISELSEEEFALLDLTNYYAAANPIVIPEVTFAETLLDAASLGTLYGLMTDEENAAKIANLTVEELKAVRAYAVTLYEADSSPSDDDTYQYRYLTGKIDNLIVKKDSSYLTEYLAKCECTPEKGVHKEDCPAYIPLPAATVTDLNITSVQAHLGLDKNSALQEVVLTHAMQFATRKDYTDLQRAYYGDWIADFVITTNTDITGADAYLAGQYDAYDADWVWLKLNEQDTLQADTPLRLITMLTNWEFPFEGIIDYIQEFQCGLWVSDEYLQNHPDFAVTVELRLYPTDASGGHDNQTYHTLSTTTYKPTLATLTYTAVTKDFGKQAVTSTAGGEVSSSETVVVTAEEVTGSTVAARDGYTFAGWFTDEACTQKVTASWIDADNKLTPQKNSEGIYEDATYYALFEEMSTTVTYKTTGNGAVLFKGETADDTITDTIGNVTGKPKTATVKAAKGYMFAGWYTDEACTALHSTNASLEEDCGTYYAKFVKDHATVTITKTINSKSSSDQSFIVTVSGTAYNGESVNVDVVIVIPAGQTSGSAKVVLPACGNDPYTISDPDTWNWRYRASANASVAISGGDSDKAVTVSSSLKNGNWLGDCDVYAYKKES